MTKEKAILIMENEQPHCGGKISFTEEERHEAYDMAIKALDPRRSLPGIYDVIYLLDTDHTIKPMDVLRYEFRKGEDWIVLQESTKNRPDGIYDLSCCLYKFAPSNIGECLFYTLDEALNARRQTVEKENGIETKRQNKQTN